MIYVPEAKREQKPVYTGGDMFKGTYRRNGEGDYHCSGDEYVGCDTHVQSPDLVHPTTCSRSLSYPSYLLSDPGALLLLRRPNNGSLPPR